MKNKILMALGLMVSFLTLVSCGGGDKSPSISQPTTNKPTIDKPSENKPTVDKPSEDKPTEIVGKLDSIKIKANRHQYLKNERLKLDLSLSERVAIKIDYSLKRNNEVIYSGSINSDKSGNAKLDLDLNSLNIVNSRYQLEFSSKAIKKNLKSYFTFEVLDNVDNSVSTYDKLYSDGYFNNIINHSPYNEEFIKSNVLKGLGGLSLSSYDGDIKSIDSFTSKPTILAFHTLGCTSCHKGMDYLSKIDLDGINILHVATGLDSDTLDLAKAEALEASKNGLDLNSFYFDTIDNIWEDYLGYNSAPQYVFLNSYSEPIAFMSAVNHSFTSYNSFYNELKEMVNKCYKIELKEKIEYININVHYMNSTEVMRIEKGSKLDIKPSDIKGYRFKGFTINDSTVDLDEHIFNFDTDLYLNYTLAGINQEDIENYNHALIDLRDEASFNGGHIDGAINVSASKFKNSFLDFKVDKSKTIILYGMDMPYEIMDYLEDLGYKSLYLMDYEIKDEKRELSYEERKAKGEMDPYYDPHIESTILKKYYGMSYLDLDFTGFDKNTHSLGEYLYLDNKPTIIMVGSTTCITCEYAFNTFLGLEDKSKFNFVEAISYSKKQDLSSLIESEKKKIGNDLQMHSKYKLFDNNRYSQDNSYTFIKAHELPVFYILDRLGNLTNVVSSFTKAMRYVEYLGDSVSIENEHLNPNRTLDDRIQSLEYKHIEDNEILYNLIKNNYASFMLKQSFYDYTHSVRNVNSFLNLNGFDKSKPTAIYIMNSANSDFQASVKLLDEIMKNSSMNILAIVDNNSKSHNDLIMKSYSSKIMFDEYNTNVNEGYTLYKSSYFVILDSNGNFTNVVLDYKNLASVYDKVIDTVSVKSPNRLTKPSIIKPNDKPIRKDEAFNSLGFISHLDSVKDMARYEYLNINYGRNYLDFEVIDSNGLNVSLKSLVDPNKETIVCFLQSYMDDFYYAFNPLYKLKDECNIIIVFTNRRDEPYNEAFVDDILALGTKKAIAKAREPQNIGSIIDIVKGENPSLSGEELDKAVDKYLENKYDYKKMKEFIYGSYAYLTTPLLETEVRGIQLYLDKNGNLASISQTYYAVGGVFKTVLNKIHGYIVKED